MDKSKFTFVKASAKVDEVSYVSREDSVWQTLKRDKRAIFAFAVLALLMLASIFAFLTPYDPNELAVHKKLQPPSVQHWFGTDEYGRDYFTRILYGGRVSLAVGFAAMTISIVIGVLYGTISAYVGGIVDSLMMRFLDVLMSLPSFFLIMILSAYMDVGILSIIVIIGLLSWMDVARIVRSQTLSIKEREFVQYARATGASTTRIIWRHLVPGILPSIIVAASLNIAFAILTESSLSFLGLGIQPPDSSWGSMLNNAQGYIVQAGYLAIFPGLFVLLLILAFNILGDSLQKAIEPKK